MVSLTKLVDDRAYRLHLRWPNASWLDAQVYYTLVDCNPLTPLLRFVPDCKTCSCAAVGKILIDTSCRMVRLLWQSFFFVWIGTHTHTHTHLFNGPLSGTTQVSRYQKGKTSLDFIGARDSEWQWHQLGHMQIYTWYGMVW